MTKKEARNLVNNCFANLSAKEKKNFDDRILSNFIKFVDTNKYKKIGSYFSLHNEVNTAYLNDYLFLRTISSHKRIAGKYFSHVEDRSYKRIKEDNFVNYKGNLKVRNLATKLMNLKYVGDIFAKVFVINASTDLFLRK